MQKKRRILYFIQLPPPVHGVSVINSKVYNSSTINRFYDKQLLEIRFSDRISELRRITISKIIRFVVLVIKLCASLIISPPDGVYFSIMPVGKGFYRDAVFVFIMKLFRRKIVFHLHNQGIHNRLKSRMNRFLYHKVFNNSTIIHLSQKLVEKEFGKLDLKNANFFVIPNGISYEGTTQVKDNGRRGNHLRLVFVSNLFPEKGIFELLRAFQILRKKYTQISLSVIGAHFKNIDKQLNNYFLLNYKFKNDVIFHGALYGAEKIQVLESSDIFVFPSRFDEECFPLVILEAMAAGLAIVATDIGVVSEIIDDGVNGCIIPVGNQERLISQIEYFIVNPGIREKLGKEARKKFENHFTLANFERNMSEVLQNIISIESA